MPAPDDDLDVILAALANPGRREIVRLLALHPEAISRLAVSRGLSLPAMNKHVAILERAGLVNRHKVGRTTYLTLGRASIQRVQAWLADFNPHWGSDEASLENYLAYLASASSTRRRTTS